jgi:hypothetical protein
LSSLSLTTIGWLGRRFLIFETNRSITRGLSVPASYGSNAESASRVESDGRSWLYGQGNGFAPNITVVFAVWTTPINFDMGIGNVNFDEMAITEPAAVRLNRWAVDLAAIRCCAWLESHEMPRATLLRDHNSSRHKPNLEAE